MIVKCGWASIDEHGRIKGGKAGDQTGKEVLTGNWYKFGQTAVYRWKDRTKAKQFAACIESICNNKNVGYDQGQRGTLNSELKKLKWDYKKLKTPCECDCSDLVVAGVNCIAKKELLSPKLYTGNIGNALMNTKMFTKLTGARYCSSDKYLAIGDIINKPNSHVIVALSNGSKTVTAEKKAEKKTKKSVKAIAKEIVDGKCSDARWSTWGVGAVRKNRLKSAGYDYATVQKEVNKLMKK